GLVRGMGLWDVILFNIAAVVGPRWVASAAHTGPNSIGLWLTAAALFFLPTALVITELATRYPHVGGVYAWTQEAFGPFHGFVSGWVYWTYSIVYFPALLNASVAMAAYMGGPKMAALATNKPFVICGSLLILGLAIWMNIVGVKIGKWLENAGAIGTYVPLTVLVLFGAWFAARFGSATHIGVSDLKLHVNWGTINYWSQIAFAFSGLEVVCFMSEEGHPGRGGGDRRDLCARHRRHASHLASRPGGCARRRDPGLDQRRGAVRTGVDRDRHRGAAGHRQRRRRGDDGGGGGAGALRRRHRSLPAAGVRKDPPDMAHALG